MIPPELIKRILAEYILPLDGIHGVAHWARVWENGRRLEDRTGAMIEVVEFFTLLHDARRANEGRDDGHGRRAAALARDLWKSHLHLSDPDFELLVAACEDHTDGRTEGDITVQTCWDADRLDLFGWESGRIFYAPLRSRTAKSCSGPLNEVRAFPLRPGFPRNGESISGVAEPSKKH